MLNDTIQWSFSSDINVCQSHTMTESYKKTLKPYFNCFPLCSMFSIYISVIVVCSFFVLMHMTLLLCIIWRNTSIIYSTHFHNWSMIHPGIVHVDTSINTNLKCGNWNCHSWHSFLIYWGPSKFCSNSTESISSKKDCTVFAACLSNS